MKTSSKIVLNVLARPSFILITMFVLMISLNACYKDNLKQSKVLDGEWAVIEHQLVFYNHSSPRRVSCDTTLYNSGKFTFTREDNQSGEFTFVPTEEGIVIKNYAYCERYGTWRIHHSPTYNTLYFALGTHELPDIVIEIVDFDKDEQTWYINKDVGHTVTGNDVSEIIKIKRL